MKRLNKKQNNKAFTIIEVVLVLAVAGLIFLVVFAAVPRLQASRRDNARKDHLRTVMAEFENLASNTGNSNKYTGASAVHNSYIYGQAQVTSFCNEYLYLGEGQSGDHGWKDPSTGSGYSCIWSAAAPTVTNEVRMVWYYVCTPSGGYAAASPADYSVVSARIKLERGVYCLDNT